MEKDVAVIYSKTALGEQAESAMDEALSAEMLRALTLIDGEATLDELLAKLPNQSNTWLGKALTELVSQGYLELVENGPDENGFDENAAEGVGEDKAKLRARAQRRLAARAREEAERQAGEEAERRAREESERLAREEAERLAGEEAARLKREEDARIVREEAERIAREEAERLAREEAKRQARAEAERKAREEAERLAREEEERRAREAAEAEARKRAEIEAEERERAEIEARARAFVEARAKEEENKVQKPVYVVKKKPVPWGMVALSMAVILVLAPLALLHVMSLNMLAPVFEKLASDTMGEPVAVGAVHASLWPTPHFKLENVAIGHARDIKLPAVRVMPEVASLMSDTKVIRAVEVESLLLGQGTLGRASQWLAQGDPTKLRLGRVALKNVKVEVKGLELPPFSAEIQVGEEGGFKRAHLHTLDRKLEADIEPKGGEFVVKVNADHWLPLVGPQLMFDELSVKATASRDGMRLEEIRARLYGGTAKGNATVKWGEMWAAEGGFDLENMDLAPAAEVFTRDIALSGRLNANASFSLQARELAGLFETPGIRASFSSRDGAIGTLDFAHALQSRAREYVGNGKTGYANWTGNLTVNGNAYRYSQMRLDAGLLYAGGEAAIAPNKELSGSANVEMKLKSAPVRARFAVTGNLTRLVLRRAD